MTEIDNLLRMLPSDPTPEQYQHFRMCLLARIEYLNLAHTASELNTLYRTTHKALTEKLYHCHDLEDQFAKTLRTD